MPHEDLTAITCYFNPEHYRNRLKNYKLFRDRLRYQNIPCLTVECALEGSFFELEPGPDVILVRAKDSLWQKERLLNIAIDNTPDSCSKIVWLDCDVLFSDYNWADKASELLDRYPIIQPWNRVAYLTPAGPEADEDVRYQTSFASNRGKAEVAEPHGHCGFAWVARRDLLLKHHLYDAGIMGHGDHFIAHAIHGDYESPCLQYHIHSSESQEHYIEWAQPFFDDVQGQSVSLVGEIKHLWHGEHRNRMYRKRHIPIKSFEFNPKVDIKLNSEGVWEWATDKPVLHEWVRSYFKKRLEDGDPSGSSTQIYYPDNPRDPYPRPYPPSPPLPEYGYGSY